MPELELLERVVRELLVLTPPVVVVEVVGLEPELSVVELKVVGLELELPVVALALVGIELEPVKLEPELVGLDPKPVVLDAPVPDCLALGLLEPAVPALVVTG